MFHVSTNGFRLINNKNSTELVANYNKNSIFILNHKNKSLEKYLIRDLIVNLKRNKAQPRDDLKKLKKGKNILLNELIKDFQISNQSSFQFEKVKAVKKIQNKGSIIYHIKNDKRLLHSLTLVPSSKFQLNKKDIKILEKAFKTLYLFQASLGQVDERSVERSYLQLLKKHRALLSESTSYEFDIRQKRKSKITKVEKAALNIDKFKVPKDYSQSLFSIKN